MSLLLSALLEEVSWDKYKKNCPVEFQSCLGFSKHLRWATMIQLTPVVKRVWLDDDIKDSASYAMSFDTRFNSLADVFRECDYTKQNMKKY